MVLLGRTINAMSTRLFPELYSTPEGLLWALVNTAAPVVKPLPTCYNRHDPLAWSNHESMPRYPDPRGRPGAGEPGEFSGMRVFTESDVQDGNNNYPFAGPNTIEAAEWHAHPLFTESAFFLHDVGVVLLTKAFKLPADQYGKLPTTDQLDALKPSSSTTFTAVGYGVQRINPVKIEAERIRMFAEPHLVQINGGIVGDFSLLLSNNASTGGTCFGDSGGPNFVGSSNVIGGVTSFGLNGTCGGTGGVFRLDRKNVLAFVGQYLR